MAVVVVRRAVPCRAERISHPHRQAAKAAMNESITTNYMEGAFAVIKTKRGKAAAGSGRHWKEVDLVGRTSGATVVADGDLQ